MFFFFKYLGTFEFLSVKPLLVTVKFEPMLTLHKIREILGILNTFMRSKFSV